MSCVVVNPVHTLLYGVLSPLTLSRALAGSFNQLDWKTSRGVSMLTTSAHKHTYIVRFMLEMQAVVFITNYGSPEILLGESRNMLQMAVHMLTLYTDNHV